MATSAHRKPEPSKRMRPRAGGNHPIPGKTLKPKMKSAPRMKKKARFELRLTATHLVVAFGIVMGSMLAAFFVGLSTGRTSGFEMASQDALIKSVRLPIAEEYTPEEAQEDERVSQVYAKLQETLPQQDGDPETEIPSLKTEQGQAEKLVRSQKESQPDSPEPSAEVQDLSDNEEDLKSVKNQLERNANEASQQALLLEKKQKEQVSSLGDAVRVLGDDTAPVKEPVQMKKRVPIKNAESKTTPAVPRETKEKKTLGGLLELSDSDVAQRNVSKKAVIESVKTEPVKTIPTKKALRTEPKIPATQPIVVKKPQNNIKVTTSVSRGWYAQVAARRDKSDALRLAQKLKGSGFPVVLEEADVRGTRYYRVLTGPENSRVMGERLLSQLKREKFVTSDPFLRPVK